jgi:hypothetical protein
MKSVTTIVARYFEAWNSATEAHALAALEDACAKEVAYTDPQHECVSPRALAAHIHRTRERAPAYRVNVISAVDGYDATFRYAWIFEADGQLRFSGLDVITTDAEGRIATITSFFGELQQADEGASTLRLQPRFGS